MSAFSLSAADELVRRVVEEAEAKKVPARGQVRSMMSFNVRVCFPCITSFFCITIIYKTKSKDGSRTAHVKSGSEKPSKVARKGRLRAR